MNLLPHEIVEELDRHVVGQADAKRVIAVALRNRWRRMKVDADKRSEITPKNILMVGPTGVGKTELARRLAKIEDAPFIKVEATKFTEVGYVGASVGDMINDLVQMAIKKVELSKAEKKASADKVPKRLRDLYEVTLFACLQPDSLTDNASSYSDGDNTPSDLFRQMVHSNAFDDHDMHYRYDKKYLTTKGAKVLPAVRGKTPKVIQMKVKDFRKRFLEIEDKPVFTWQQIEEPADLFASIFNKASGMTTSSETKDKAIKSVENNGIVFIDEIDKLALKDNSTGGGISRQGVQRDLLTLVEGTTVTTKYGMVDTTNILFIASGAFHVAKVSDLLPELQGRFPIKVQLQPLSVEDFVEILSHTEMSIITQYKTLLATDGIQLDFKPEAIQRLAEISHELNQKIDNIGARRLHSVIEKLLQEASYIVNNDNVTIVIDSAYVDKQLGTWLFEARAYNKTV